MVVFFSNITSNAFRVLINKNNDLTHRYTTEVIALILFWIIIVIDPTFALNMNTTEIIKVNYYAWINFIFPGLLILGCLVYNENIILYFFGLELYTRKEIMKRADNEMELALINSQLIIEEKTDDNDQIDIL